VRARRSTAERLSGGGAQKNRRLRSMVRAAEDHTTQHAVAFSLFNTAHGPARARVRACWIDQQAAKLTSSK
jgi:hypothetical protein